MKRSGWMVEKTVWKLSGHGSSPEGRGERSRNPSSLCLAGAKLRVFEPFTLSADLIFTVEKKMLT
jgi:hypothetical protein